MPGSDSAFPELVIVKCEILRIISGNLFTSLLRSQDLYASFFIVYPFLFFNKEINTFTSQGLVENLKETQKHFQVFQDESFPLPAMEVWEISQSKDSDMWCWQSMQSTAAKRSLISSCSTRHRRRS